MGQASFDDRVEKSKNEMVIKHRNDPEHKPTLTWYVMDNIQMSNVGILVGVWNGGSPASNYIVLKEKMSLIILHAVTTFRWSDATLPI